MTQAQMFEKFQMGKHFPPRIEIPKSQRAPANLKVVAEVSIYYAMSNNSISEHSCCNI